MRWQMTSFVDCGAWLLDVRLDAGSPPQASARGQCARIAIRGQASPRGAARPGGRPNVLSDCNDRMVGNLEWRSQLKVRRVVWSWAALRRRSRPIPRRQSPFGLVRERRLSAAQLQTTLRTFS